MKHQDWKKFLTDIIFLLNYPICDSLSVVPAQLYLNETSLVSVQEVLGLSQIESDSTTPSWYDKLLMTDNRIRSKKEQRNQRVDKSRSSFRSIIVRDLVFLRNPTSSSACDKYIKIFYLYTGPYFCMNKPSDKVLDLLEPLSGTIVGRPSDAAREVWKTMVKLFVTSDVYNKIFSN